MKNSDLELRRCSVKDVDEIMVLQDQVLSEIEGDKSILRRNDAAMFEQCMKEPHLSMGLYDGEELVGICILYDGRGDDEDLSIGLERFTATCSINLKLIMIRKKYQGMGFQRGMIWISEKIACARGYEYFCATVSPINKYSRNNCLASGFQYDHTAVKYGGADRDVLVKKLGGAEAAAEVIQRAKALEGSSRKGAVIEGIDLEKCYRGSIELATTGDVIAFENADTGEITYGLYLLQEQPGVLLFDAKKQCLAITAYEEAANNLRVKQVWINPIGGSNRV